MPLFYCCFFFNDPPTTDIYTYRHTLSLHDALPILSAFSKVVLPAPFGPMTPVSTPGASVQSTPCRIGRPPIETCSCWAARVTTAVARASDDREKIGRAHV